MRKKHIAFHQQEEEMSIITTLPVDREITNQGSVMLHVTAGKVQIKLFKRKKKNNSEVWVPVLSSTYAARAQGYSNTLKTETGVHRWKVTVKPIGSLSAMELTIP